jgi:hypothetical protein
VVFAAGIVLNQGASTYLGSATYGAARPDVAGVYGAHFLYSGWTLTANPSPNLAPDLYLVRAVAHSTVTMAFGEAHPQTVFA